TDITAATGDENKTFGGTLSYNGDNNPYNDDVDGTYDYTADGALPGYVGEDDFDVQLWDGENSYVFTLDGDVWVATPTPEYGSGTIDLAVTNTLPGGAVVLEDAHMNASGETLSVVSGDFTDADDPISIVDITPATDDENKVFSGYLAYNGSDDPYVSGDTYDYTASPLPGYVGEDDFDVQLWDGQNNYEFTLDGDVWVATPTPEYGSGTIDLTVTNTLPTAGGDLGTTPQDTPLEVIQQTPPTDSTTPVFVNDDDAPLDNLSIIKDTYFGSAGGTLEFDGTKWIYTPASGYNGPEEFIVNVSDGQYNWVIEQIGDGIWMATGTPEYGDGAVSVTVSEEEIIPVPVAPLPVLEFPEIGGCPALMTWLAGELGVGEEQIQIYMANVLAFSKDIHPCDICERLMNATRVIDNIDAGRAAALASMINAEVGPLAGPPSEEQMALIATASETLIENTQYTSATELIDAVVEYINILIDEMGMEADEAIALFMDKHGESISEDASVAAYFGSLFGSL
ncbi:MAG: Ig-like domain-containing protein, partial [Planctomycetota bacterium]